MKWIRNCEGVAMTEGILVLPFLLVIWIGLLAVTRIYERQQDLETDAAARVLEMAAAGRCSEVSQEAAPGVGTVRRQESDLLSRLGGTSPLVPAHSQVAISQEVSAFPPAAGRGTVRLSAKRIMMCNTRPVDGLMDQIVADVRAMLGL